MGIRIVTLTFNHKSPIRGEICKNILQERLPSKKDLTEWDRICYENRVLAKGRGGDYVVSKEEGVLDKEHYSILIFGPSTSKTRHLRIAKKTFKISLYLFAFFLLSSLLLLCDYIQVKKKVFELGYLHEETQVQKAQIHFFSSKIEDLEKQVSKLKEFDKKIRIIANLEPGQETTPLVGIGGGGPSPSDVRGKLRDEKDKHGLAAD